MSTITVGRENSASIELYFSGSGAAVSEDPTNYCREPRVGTRGACRSDSAGCRFHAQEHCLSRLARTIEIN